MKASDVIASTRLKAVDVKPHGIVRLTIIGAGVAEFPADQADPNGRKKKMIELSFRGTDKTLLLNRINTETLIDLLGDETDVWAGHKIELYTEKASTPQGIKDAIRLRLAQAVPAPQAPRTPYEPAQGRHENPDSYMRSTAAMDPHEIVRGIGHRVNKAPDVAPDDDLEPIADSDLDDDIPF